MIYETKVLLQDVPGKLGLNLFIFRIVGEDMFVPIIKNGVMVGEKKLARGGVVDQPVLYLPDELLILLPDALAKRGFKPQKGFLEGKLEAASAHLDDMRKLVFEKK